MSRRNFWVERHMSRIPTSHCSVYYKGMRTHSLQFPTSAPHHYYTCRALLISLKLNCTASVSSFWEYRLFSKTNNFCHLNLNRPSSPVSHCLPSAGVLVLPSEHCRSPPASPFLIGACSDTLIWMLKPLKHSRT